MFLNTYIMNSNNHFICDRYETKKDINGNDVIISEKISLSELTIKYNNFCKNNGFL